MFEAPVDSWYVWIGLAAVGTATLGVALSFPAVGPPDAAAAAETIDSVAASPHQAVASHRLQADRIRLRPNRISLGADGSVSHASVAYGPVTPTSRSAPLTAVLRGERPAAVFESPEAFAAASERARNRRAKWRPAPEVLRVARVSWEGVDVTLVGP